VQPRHRVFALDARHEVVDRGLIGDFTDDLEEGRPLGGFLGVGGIQQIAHRIAGLLRGDDVENRGFGHALLAQGIEERRRRVALAGG
jgi:hypothetical protein